MYQHCVVHGLDQALKQVLAILQPRTALFQIFQQFVDGGAELAQRSAVFLRARCVPGAPLARVRWQIWLENSLTARSWRCFQARSTTKPTARMAAVTNHNSREDRSNLDLDDDESYQRLILGPFRAGHAANHRDAKNSSWGSRRLRKLTIISGLNRAREIMDTLAARQQMVDQQIRTWEVLDPRVLDALSTVPREVFVPPEYRELAFADAPIPIGFGQRMLAPKLQGRILQALSVAATDSVLEIGCGTGYLAAAFSLLGASTRSVDIHPQFSAAAAANLVPSRVQGLSLRRGMRSAMRRWANTT